ncbi:MAG: hypothetical protein KC766_14235 [Myxococcales bacterium]|nr:hypothetical protein [Myxococcales bacterium]
MGTFGSVPAHSAFVGGEQATVTIGVSLASPATLELRGPQAAAYSFVTGPELTETDQTVTLAFRPQAQGESRAELGVVAGVDHVDVVGEGESPIVFSQHSLGFGSVLVGEQELKGVLVENHAVEALELGLDGDGEFSLGQTSVEGAGVPVFIPISFRPSAKQGFSALVTARINGFEEVLALSGSGVDTLDDGVIQEEFAGADEDDGAGKATRFSAFVPTHASRLNMGAPSPSDAGENRIKIDGIGLTTNRKILLRSVGPQESSPPGEGKLGDTEAALMATGRTFVQSNLSDVVVAAHRDTITAAGRTAYVLGDASVLIATTAEDTVSKDDDDFPELKLDSDGAPSTLGGAQTATRVFTLLDAFVASVQLGRAFVSYAGLESRWTSTGAKIAAAGAGALFGAVISTLGATKKAQPAVTIYGHAGLLMGTPGFGGLYCTAGLAIASLFPLIAGVDAEMFGVSSARVTGHRAGIGSNMETAVTSHKKVVIKADGVGPAPIGSWATKAGELLGITEGEVEIEAKTNVHAHVSGGYSLTMTQDNVRVQIPPPPGPAPFGPAGAPSGDLELGNQLVRFMVGTVQVELTGNTVTLDDGQNGRVEVSGGVITMTGRQNERVRLRQGAIELQANTIDLQGAGNQGIRVSPRQAQVRASRITLG